MSAGGRRPGEGAPVVAPHSPSETELGKVPPVPPMTYAATQPLVEELCASLGSAARVAVDTEADSFHHYREQLCLVQLSTGDVHWVVDPLAGVDLRPLLDRLQEKPLIFHGADYDLRMLRTVRRFRAGRVFDTMLAAQLAGHAQLGLAALVDRYCGLVLPKRHQKADWSRRPLTADMLTYAVLDAVYLPLIADRLTDELQSLGRLDWHRETCDALVVSLETPRERDPEERWRLKGWRPLEPRGWAILRELWHWREAEARGVDVPAFMVLGHEAVVALAAWGMAHGPDELPQGHKLPRNCVGRRLDALRETLARARALPASAWPVLPAPRPRMSMVQQRLLADLKARRDAAAAKVKMAPELLVSNRTLEQLVGSPPHSPQDLQRFVLRWQQACLGPGFVRRALG